MRVAMSESPKAPSHDEPPAPDDAALAEEIRFLGRVFGDTVAELHGPEALALVEGTRRSAVALRQGRLPGGRAAFAASLAGRPLAELTLLAEAFTGFFHLINTAEELHRVRALRARDRAGSVPVRDSIAAAVAELAAAGTRAEDVQALLDRMLVMPVLTAHPTEARRRTILDHLAEASEVLEALRDPRAGTGEQTRAEERLREVVAALAATRGARTSRPSPQDEVRAGLRVFERTLLDAVPALYREVGERLRAQWPRSPVRVPPFLRFGSWIGGDRDGNPFVTAEVTRYALERQRAIAVARHVADAQDLWRELSAALPAGARAVREALDASIGADRERLGEPPAATRALRPDERWREKLRYVQLRLEAARVRGEGAYPDARAYRADLELLQRSLEAVGLARLARGRLEDARRRAEVFGFHLASLDVRQHSAVHERAVAEILGLGGADGYADLPEGRRLEVLGEVLSRPWLPAQDRSRLSPETREVLDTLEVVGRARRDTGSESCERYVVSFTNSVSDLLEVLVLERAAGLAPGELRPVPLLEQLEDLERAGALVEEALRIPELVAAFRGELEVMIGYSDSGKQVGYVASRAAVHKAQLVLAQVAEAEGLVLTVFHGRGGSVGRGGGPSHRAIQAQPAAALRGRLRVTEQGETVAARYGNAEIARRELEQMVSAVLSGSAGPAEPAAEDAVRSRERAMDVAAGSALRAWRELVADPDRLARYALAATPMAEVPELRFASRPASRVGAVELASLRAIPWVFSWNQSRHGIPGWFGLGRALGALSAEGAGGGGALYRNWPFLRGLVDDARLALTQADIDVASFYAALAAPEDRVIFDRIREEHALTVAEILRVTGDPGLLTPWPALARAAERRNPYVDVLSHLQIELLGRTRSGPAEERERAREVLVLTVNGIAAGLQTVG